MINVIARLRSAAQKRAAYNQTIAELSRLPRDLAIEDLNICKDDAALIARHAVYGY